MVWLILIAVVFPASSCGYTTIHLRVRFLSKLQWVGPSWYQSTPFTAFEWEWIKLLFGDCLTFTSFSSLRSTRILLVGGENKHKKMRVSPLHMCLLYCVGYRENWGLKHLLVSQDHRDLKTSSRTTMDFFLLSLKHLELILLPSWKALCALGFWKQGWETDSAWIWKYWVLGQRHALEKQPDAE